MGYYKFESQRTLVPQYDSMMIWESYADQLDVEYRQCEDEGLDIRAHKALFDAVRQMEPGIWKARLADVLFQMVINASMRSDYPYFEPSDIEGIRALRRPYQVAPDAEKEIPLSDRIHGAWMGRACGCLLGKTLEGMKSGELQRLLKETDNWPLRRYVLWSDLTEEMFDQYTYPLREQCYADLVQGMPEDDDTNYLVLAQELVEQCGRDFTPWDVAGIWMEKQKKGAYCTAERIAYHNFVRGYRPPESAIYQNPYREYIGAQIRGDYFGYINPGDPETAADMAFRDASISHVKNGIYGEMFAAAMIACSAVTDDIEQIIRGGLAQIPETSRLYEAVMGVLEGYRQGVAEDECFRYIHNRYDEHTDYGFTHTIPNAMVVVAALLYGRGDFGRSICIAVENSYDTDCNGATVGSILGMRNGIAGIPLAWSKPIGDIIETSIIGVGRVSISQRAARTLSHLKQTNRGGNML